MKSFGTGDAFRELSENHIGSLIIPVKVTVQPPFAKGGCVNDYIREPFSVQKALLTYAERSMKPANIREHSFRVFRLLIGTKNLC